MRSHPNKAVDVVTRPNFQFSDPAPSTHGQCLLTQHTPVTLFRQICTLFAGCPTPLPARSLTAQRYATARILLYFSTGGLTIPPGFAPPRPPPASLHFCAAP